MNDLLIKHSKAADGVILVPPFCQGDDLESEYAVHWQIVSNPHVRTDGKIADGIELPT